MAKKFFRYFNLRKDANPSPLSIQAGPIALLGTSADPPSRGHQVLLEGLLTLFPKVITWVSNNPQKSHQISLEKRTMLLKALVQSISNQNLELIQELSSPWTIHTLEMASQKWPQDELLFVIGSDLISQVSKWEKSKDFLCKATLGIVPRIGWPVESEEIQKLQSLGAQVRLLPLEIPATASSKIRLEQSIQDVPPAVLEILLKENIYDLHRIL